MLPLSLLTALTLVLLLHPRPTLATSASAVLVVGSVNADVIVPLRKMPAMGETVVALNTADSGKTLAGGKGANQAVSCSRLGAKVHFACQLGSDANAEMLERTLSENAVDLTLSRRSEKPSGMGIVLLNEGGAGSCIVVGGSNAAWPEDFRAADLLPANHKYACVMVILCIANASTPPLTISSSCRWRFPSGSTS